MESCMLLEPGSILSFEPGPICHIEPGPIRAQSCLLSQAQSATSSQAQSATSIWPSIGNLASCLDTAKYDCYVDIPGHQHPNGGTLPPEVAVSTLKPDIVIVDKKKKSVAVFELTCPAEHRIATAHTLKANKYSHFESDNTHMSVTVQPFEIGSHTGYVSTGNKTRLALLHKFCKNPIKLKSFVKNISAICVLGSYYIFNCCGQKWHEFLHLSQTNNHQTSSYSYRKKPV